MVYNRDYKTLRFTAPFSLHRPQPNYSTQTLRDTGESSSTISSAAQVHLSQATIHKTQPSTSTVCYIDIQKNIAVVHNHTATMMLHYLAPLLLCATAHGAIYSQYSLDGPTVTDAFGLTNSTKEILLGSGDNAVCGSSYHMKAGDFVSLGSSNGAPTGNVDFSVGGYVKPVTLAQRALFAIGGNFKDDDGATGNWGAWVLVDSKGALSVRTLKLNQKSSATIVVGKWSQVLLTYTASETMLRLWVDGVLALSHEVTMDLRKNSRYGGMAIGEFHLGGSPWGRGGEYFMDHVSFANTVLSVAEAEASCLSDATLAAPGTVMVVKELLRIALGVLFSLFDADTFLADLLAFLSEQVTSGKLRWTCPESACVNGCPATSALKIAAECNSHDSSVARNAQLLASGNVVVEFEPEYAEGNSADTVKLALDREAAAPTTLAKYYVGAVDVVQSEVVIVHVDDSDGNDDLQAGYIVLIVAMVLLFLVIVIIVVLCLVSCKKKRHVKEKVVANCPTNEVTSASV